MRVAVVTTSYPEHEGDASGHFVRAEVRALERKGCMVHVFVPRAAAFGWPGVLPRLRERPTRAFSGAASLATLSARLRRSGPFDEVIAHWLPTTLLTAGVKGPLTAVAHGSDVRLLASLPAPVRTRALGALIARSTKVRVVSSPLAEDLLACAGKRDRVALSAKMDIAPSPIEIPDVDAARVASLRSSMPTRCAAVTVARLIPSKRIDRVLSHVAEQGRDWSLVVVGDGPERAALERRSRELGVTTRFVGQVDRDEALSWIAAGDVLVHASESEGASTVLREAEALGTKVVVLA